MKYAVAYVVLVLIVGGWFLATLRINRRDD